VFVQFLQNVEKLLMCCISKPRSSYHLTACCMDVAESGVLFHFYLATNSILSMFTPFSSLQDSIYDPRSHTGHLVSYIRCRRSRDPEITTLWTHSAARKLRVGCIIITCTFSCCFCVPRPINGSFTVAIF
jgi:hypothetical protein